MTLNEAQAIVNSGADGPQAGKHFLVCTFEPLHLETFLEAHLIRRLGGPVKIETGLYGDFTGNILLAEKSDATSASVVLEWESLDPRLGLRASGGWGSAVKEDIVSSCRARLAQAASGIRALALRMPVAVGRPHLPIPPIGHTIAAQQSFFELELERLIAEFLAGIAVLPGVRIARPVAGGSNALDARMELLAGFPYTVKFASELADALVEILFPPAPKKGLITDADDTLWSGIAGEVGPENVTWSQEHRTQTYALYQQMLGHLSSCGVLLSVCSKNDPETVEKALARKDLLLAAESFFPVRVNWGPKSVSVSEILNVWNIAADDVVFVDDNEMELEEVRRKHPGITTLKFDGRNPAALWALLENLRNLFGKPTLTEEDRLRQASIRSSAQIELAGEAAGNPEFLRTLNGTVTLAWAVAGADKRPLELVNKTNQFNLNGVRISEGEWQQLVRDPSTVVAVGSYEDKFGPLGKVAVVVGRQTGDTVELKHWVMSCRAFSRRLEHHMLDEIFRKTGARRIEMAFVPTERNRPLREYFEAIGIPVNGGVTAITLGEWEERRGILPHRTIDVAESI
jgi:FkbH-like protein